MVAYANCILQIYQSLSHGVVTASTNWILYLNDGKGYAWAGQTRAKDSPPRSSKVPIDFELEENLGAAPPIGSVVNKIHFSKKICFKTIIKI